jgi:aspartyl-tRNA(Asn)/glutamyl-tRNA(Gln) amidotransferase subunit A
MTAEALHELTAAQAAQLIRAQQVSPVELVEHLIARAEAIDPGVQAWETLDAPRALEAARTAETLVRESATAQLGPLHGVPFGAKDIFDTAGLRTSASFRPYMQRVPTADSEPVARLKRAGAILLGKMVTTQFAYADPSRTRNPWSAERTPGGSSSGSAAGVAAREVPLALGSQTAGSVLRPAAYNGVIGFKPTYGRVSKRGVLPLAWSLDHVGVLARSVEDCALFLEAAAGHDPADPTTVAEPVAAYMPEPEPPAPRLGLLRPALDRAVPTVREHVTRVAEDFEAAGARLVEVQLEVRLDVILGVHHVIMQAEAAAVHWQLIEQYPGSHAPRLRAYVEVGRLLPGAVYLHAQRLRRRIRAALAAALSSVDALLLPTARDVAPTTETTGDPSLQAPFSLAGVPSLSLPSGLLERSDLPTPLPLAVQLVAAPWQEARLLSVARWCEQRLPAMPAPPLVVGAPSLTP